MSRHAIETFDPNNTAIVGWDPPLQTFFALVKSRLREKRDPDDPFLLWIGCEAGEIADVEALAAQLAPFAELAPEIRAALEADREHER